MSINRTVRVTGFDSARENKVSSEPYHGDVSWEALSGEAGLSSANRELEQVVRGFLIDHDAGFIEGASVELRARVSGRGGEVVSNLVTLDLVTTDHRGRFLLSYSLEFPGADFGELVV